MSTRPFWVLFILCIVIISELLIIKPTLDWWLTESIATSDIQYNQVFPNASPQPERIVERNDIKNFSLIRKIDAMINEDRIWTSIYILLFIITGALIGVLAGSILFRQIIKLNDHLREWSTTDKLISLLGLIIGLLISFLFLPAIFTITSVKSPLIMAFTGLLITYGCIMALLSMKDDIKYYVIPGLSKDAEVDDKIQKPKILDTNVIIDGRISDVSQTGFLEGKIYIPTFVLEELQHIADSSDSLRRARGRRGLDILNQMRKDMSHDLIIKQSAPVDPENTEEVDARLVKLAKEIDGYIVTNDFNLNKVAELQGVKVLNINELANALKPVVLPGEEMSINIIKDGKEINQGIGYLDDGTMIVVEGARKYIGSYVDVIVTSVLQTVAGKMIFANLKSVQEEEEDLIDRNIRNYSSVRPRKKTR